MGKRITILALGSRGDVQPLVALGHALQVNGHAVRVATFESFRELVTGTGLGFHPVPGDARGLVEMASSGGMTSRNPITMIRGIQHSYGAIVADYVESFSDGALSDSEAVINQLPGGLFGRDLAEKLGVPHITAAVIPLLATHAFPMPLLLARSTPGISNRWTYIAAEQLFWLFFRRATNTFRKRLGLGQAPLVYHPPNSPTLLGFSPLVIPPPPDWAAQVYTTGWWMLEEPAWAPPPELAAFLEAGPPPVFIGFGSMVAPDPAALTDLLREALTLTGMRAVLSRGWAGLGGAHLPATIYALDYAPYSWLFPRMAAVVHHGGSGTTGFALHSGVPSLVVSFAADQPFWGWRTAELGVGLPPIPVKEITAQQLASALDRLTSDASLHEHAQRLSEALRHENGLASAVELINALI
ncbi:MAG TPA: glycosyltransferase [Candidatus Limnocylindrales bacterium]|nr:glycosyltransferase [Candidatus Limnocylindrales bacterium]